MILKPFETTYLGHLSGAREWRASDASGVNRLGNPRACVRSETVKQRLHDIGDFARSLIGQGLEFPEQGSIPSRLHVGQGLGVTHRGDRIHVRDLPGLDLVRDVTASIPEADRPQIVMMTAHATVESRRSSLSV